MRIVAVLQTALLFTSLATLNALGAPTADVPTAPKISLVTRSLNSLSIFFDPKSSKDAKKYQYTLDGGITWTNGVRRENSIFVSKVDPANRYQIALRGVNARGVGQSSTTYGTKLALFVGASITAGSGGYGSGWVNQVGSRFNWQIANLATNNSGYGLPKLDSANCKIRLNFASQLGCGLAFTPDIVFISGGLNDCGASSNTQSAGEDRVLQTYQFAHDHYPNAIVVGTPVITFATNNCLNQLNSSIESATSQTSSHFISGAQAWLPGQTKWKNDSVHPNLVGHTFIARKIIAWLIKQKLALS